MDDANHNPPLPVADAESPTPSSVLSGSPRSGRQNAMHRVASVRSVQASQGIGWRRRMHPRRGQIANRAFRRLCEQKLIPLSPPSFAPGWTRAEAIAEKRGSSV